MEYDLDDVEKECLASCRKQERQMRSMWLSAIEYSPKLARYCPCLNDFTPTEWSILLSHDASFINIAPIHRFSINDWYWVLLYQAELADLCPCLKEFSLKQKKYLLKNQPQLADRL